MQRIKKLTALVLAVIMTLSVLVVSASAKTDYVPDYDTETPVIFIHGMGQNDTYLLDENGNRKLNAKGEVMTGWPLQIDIMALIRNALPGLLASVFTRKDNGFSEGMEKGTYAALSNVEKDKEGNYLTPVEVPCFPYSFAQMSEDEKAQCYSHIPIQELTDIIGEEDVYYFGYDTFGSVSDTADKLHWYINDIVLPQTGAEKVTICPISLGGTVAVQYLEKYPQDYSLIKRALFFVPAIDGSDIIGDILTYNLSFLHDDETLYENLLVTLLGDSFGAYLINMVLRILPSDVLKSGLRGLAKGLIEVAIRSCTQMWALCPDAYYAEARELWLTDDTYSVIRDEVDAYMTARANVEENLNKLQAEGAEIFNLVSYGVELFPVCRDYRTTNADGIIDSNSTSFGATFADLGTTFPEDYTPAGTYCTEHNHISPDRTVDPSTCLFPCRTWFIKGQPHERLASNDAAISLSVQLLCDDNMKDVYSNPEDYPQYNGYRLTKDYKNSRDMWQEADKTGLSQEQINAVNEAIVNADALLNETIVDTEAWAKAEADFNSALIGAGLLEDNTPSKIENALTSITRTANRYVNAFYAKIGK